jgi:hypothetical protein
MAVSEIWELTQKGGGGSWGSVLSFSVVGERRRRILSCNFVVGGASGLGRGSSCVGGGGLEGGVRQFEGVEGNVCTELCGCRGHLGHKEMLEGVLQSRK